MQHLATALAIALSYINNRSDDQAADDDITALESVVSELQAATDEERKALISAFTILGNTEEIDDLGLNVL